LNLIPKRPIALVGFAEALSAPEVAWSLVDAGFEVFAFARKGRDSALRHSRFVKTREITPPETNAHNAAQDLRSVLSEVKGAAGPHVVVPLDDSAVWLCSRGELPIDCVSTGPRAAGVDIALNKSSQVVLAEKAGFSVPPTTRIATVERLLREVTVFPVILKPANAIGLTENRLAKGRNWICANHEELRKVAEQWRGQYDLLMQPWIMGQGEGIFGLATRRGTEWLSAHRRLRMMNPHGSGSSACISQPVPQKLIPSIERFVKESGWSGLFMVELLRDHSGTAWFVEFNGRPWGSMALSRRQGLEYPAWAAHLALDPAWEFKGPAPATGGLVCRNVARELLHLLFVLRGRQSAAMKEWPSFWRSTASILSMSPRDCLYNFRRDDINVFLTDCYCTIREQLFKSRRQKART
jgi:predicted ATP-grasp superfamily ATP-dependent carboligase